MKTYREALEYLQSRLPMFHRIGPAAYKADLNNTFSICNMLGNPEKDFPAVHIAGTNGKGSVSHMIASILQECGYKTGLFTSPHLKDFRERIRVNGRMIPKQKVIEFLNRYQKQTEKIQPSFFELTAGLAFRHFSASKVDVAVVETGLGGRLDSTNVADTILSVITNIGNDHKNLLGEDIQQRAIEKAGIMKTFVPVVIGETQRDIQSVFTEKAAALDTRCQFADSAFTAKGSRLQRVNGKLFLTADILKNNKMYFRQLTMGLGGKYQLKNVITVLAAIEQLKKSGFRITKRDIRKGLRNVCETTGLRGRWEEISKKPMIICDVGHNEEGIREVLAMINATPHRHLHAVLGFADDKEIKKLLALWPATGRYYFCKANVPRGMDAARLQNEAQKLGLSGRACQSVKSALKDAKATAGADDLIFVGGSVFVVGEII